MENEKTLYGRLTDFVKDIVTNATYSGDDFDSNLETIEDKIDYIREYEFNADDWIPVYHYRVLEEWKNMPSEYNDRGAEELGLSSTATIFERMSADLYLYVNDLFEEVLDEVKTELEETEEE
jgi:hypothetical protein